MKRSHLAQLCTHYGIASGGNDLRGQSQQVASEVLRALLRALGIPAGDEATERRSLQAALERDWRRILPPVVVMWEGVDEKPIDLSLPEATELHTLTWVLHEERGAVREDILDADRIRAPIKRRFAGELWIRHRVAVPRPAQLGRHLLELRSSVDGMPLAATTIILAPQRCYEPESVCGGRRSWGIATEMEAVRSAHNWGIGDFTDLIRLVELLAGVGGGTLAIPPLHPRAGGRSRQSDPYYPSSRCVLNPIYLDIEAIPEFAECASVRGEVAAEPFQARLRALRSDAMSDPPAVAKIKLDLLRRLFQHFLAHHVGPDSPRGRDFRSFRDQADKALQDYCLFAAIMDDQAMAPAAVGDVHEGSTLLPSAGSPEATAFARERAERIDFHVWLQWLARQQLQGVGRRSLELGLALGLSPELVPGAAGSGAEVWARPDLFATSLRIGAPSERGAPKGKDWGLVPWHPLALRESAYASFAGTLRANMQEAGAVRIRNLAALLRPFLIAPGGTGQSGAYLAYPQEELLAVLALESRRNRCLVIDSDPDGAPESIRAALARMGVLDSRLLYSERGADGGFLPPCAYPADAVVSATDPETTPLAAFWRGTDLEQRRALGLFVDEQDDEQWLVRRNNDRAHLLLALDREGLLPPHQSRDPLAVPELTSEHLRAIQVYLGRTPARLLLLQAADILGQSEPIGLPESDDAYPNRRLRQSLAIDQWLDQPEIRTLFAAVSLTRTTGLPATPVQSHTERNGTRASPRAVIPRATYRLQLHADFGFAAAARLVPYLDALGVSHCYFSPYFEARPGSTHGYDVVAHDRLNPELGSREDFEQLCETLADNDMRQILDVVPNHVGIMGGENRWWLDVLENGPASTYADYFDIDWEPLKPELRGKVLVPVLGGHYGDILDSGALKLVFSAGAFRVEYYEHHFPVDPREYPRILATGLERLTERMGQDHEDLAAFESLVTALGKLPARHERDADALIERRRDKEIHKQRLKELCAANSDLDWYVRECLRHFNGAEDYPPDPARLHELLESQAYRLAHWRVAADDINYRRFFDINDLAALRMENPRALEATHRLALELIASGKLAGLRIDHPDGLYDPAGYFGWLQQRTSGAPQDAPQPAGPDLPLYLIVEKILTGDEQLPADWPVHGTSGYDFAALADALMVDPDGAGPLTDCYRDFVGSTPALADEVYAAKRLVMRNLLSSELQVLATELSRIAETDPHTRDFTLDALRDALTEIVACFPVYRTYIVSSEVSSRDRNQVFKAISEARRRSRAADLSVFGFVRNVLLTDIAEGKPAAFRERVLHLAMKFQQYTGPVAAKGLEDTAFYRYHRLVSLNEVGSDPDRFGIGVDAYHRANQRRLESWPHAMLGGSTHDSKRSEDVRSRLHVISELPDEWRRHVERWSRLNRRLRREVDGRMLPDPGAEYLLYQTLLGAWPLVDPDGDALDALRERIRGYMTKAVKEAKLYTAWTNADSAYEEALCAFIDALFDRDRNGAFFDDFLPFQRRVARFGLFNSLSQTLLRLTAPGVPDIYQGSEIWSFSLADPDNRRPVDFGLRHALIDALAAAGDPHPGLTRELAGQIEDGRAKLFVIRQALALRRADPDLFEHGDYRSLPVEGPLSERVCAFSRRLDDRSVMVIAPRLLAGLVPEPTGSDAAIGDPFAHPDWSSTWVEAPAPGLHDRLSGGMQHARRDRERGHYRLCVADTLQRFPVGLLTSEGQDHGKP